MFANHNFMRNEDDDSFRTVYCGNLSEEVTDSVLYELFNQAGPVECVRRPKDPNGRPKTFGFIVFKHECSVPYAIELFKGTKLFNRNINVDSRSNQLPHVPVLDTHITEFTMPGNIIEQRRPHRFENDHRDHRNRKSGSSHHRSKEERDDIKASSWAELKNDPSIANRFVSNGLEQDSLQGHGRGTDKYPVMADFNALLQMGAQMMNPGIVGLQGFSGVPNMMSQMGLGLALGNNMYPSMQGRMSGGDRHSPPRERERRGYEDRGGRRDHYRGRERRRDHPYDDRHHSHYEDHRRHDREYSSSRSSHERERRNRRSR